MSYKKFKELNLLRVYYINILIASVIIIAGAIFFFMTDFYVDIEKYISTAVLVVIVVGNIIYKFKTRGQLYEIRSEMEKTCKTNEEKDKYFKAGMTLACVLSMENKEKDNIQILINTIFIIYVIVRIILVVIN